VAVRTLENRSSEPGVELLVTEALRREILRRGALRLVGDPRLADWVVRGHVLPLTTSSKSFSSVQLALEYRVTLAVELEVDRGEELEPIIFHRRTLEETELYLASADLEAGRKNRKEALRRVSEVLADRVHDALDDRLHP